MIHLCDSDDPFNMETAIGLLNRVLDGSDPQDAIRMPLRQANLIASLGLRNLGLLRSAIDCEGVRRAMENYGLFSRQIIIGERPDFLVERASKFRTKLACG
jgi:hypothetical protein